MNYFNAHFLGIYFTPKHLSLFAGGMPSGILDNLPLEGYRTPFTKQNHKNTPTNLFTRQGGARKAGL